MRITLFLALILVGSLLAGVVLANSGQPAVQETQGFVTSTAMQVFGTATETDGIAVDMNDGYTIRFPPAPSPATDLGDLHGLVFGEYPRGPGLITYQKSAGFDMAGMAAPNQ